MYRSVKVIYCRLGSFEDVPCMFNRIILMNFILSIGFLSGEK